MTDGQLTSLSWCQVPIWVPRLDFCSCQTAAGLLMWGALSYKRMGLPFTIAAGPRQCSHSRIEIQRDSWPHFTVSGSTLPQSGGPGPCIYIPQEQGGPVILAGTGFPFHRLKVKVKVMLWPTISGPVSITYLGPKIRCLLLSDSCGFVDVGRHLCWPCQRSHSQVQILWDSRPYFTVSDSTLPKPGGPGPCIYNPQAQGGPIIPLGTRSFLFHRLANWSWL
jgi:hypothetical protein